MTFRFAVLTLLLSSGLALASPPRVSEPTSEWLGEPAFRAELADQRCRFTNVEASTSRYDTHGRNKDGGRLEVHVSAGAAEHKT